MGEREKLFLLANKNLNLNSWGLKFKQHRLLLVVSLLHAALLSCSEHKHVKRQHSRQKTLIMRSENIPFRSLHSSAGSTDIGGVQRWRCHRGINANVQLVPQKKSPDKKRSWNPRPRWERSLLIDPLAWAQLIWNKMLACEQTGSWPRLNMVQLSVKMTTPEATTTASSRSCCRGFVWSWFSL